MVWKKVKCCKDKPDEPTNPSGTRILKSNSLSDSRLIQAPPPPTPPLPDRPQAPEVQGNTENKSSESVPTQPTVPGDKELHDWIMNGRVDDREAVGHVLYGQEWEKMN